MRILIIFCFLLSISTCLKYKSDYDYNPSAKVWFKEHKIIANWSEARLQCYREGAVLASPTSEETLNAMMRITQAKINKGQSYFIGVHSTYSPGHFVSLEGIPIDNMPVEDMIHRLDPREGKCLSTNGYEITVTSCETLLPYICYQEQAPNMKLTSCGTFDKDYKFEEVTGSCYKLHQDLSTWEEANSMCLSEGGYLVILNDGKEASLINAMYPRNIEVNITDFSRDWDPLYIGIRDWGSQDWRSVHGEPMEELYNIWHYSEPRPGQLCGALPRKGIPLESDYCHYKSFFVCEKDPQNIRFKEVNENET